MNMVNINAYLQQLRQDAIKGFAELSEHPVKYTSKALADFVKDYWDVGFSLASALAWTPYGREIFSEKVQAYFAGLGLPVSLVAGGSMHLRDKEKAAARIVRNGGAWFASMSLGNGFSSLDENIQLSIMNGIMGMFGLYALITGEMQRRSPARDDGASSGSLESRLKS